EREILVPIVHAMKNERRTFVGLLYAGIMFTKSGPKVLEFNARFGDPETQPLMVRWKSDIVPALLAAIDGKLEDTTIEWDPRSAVCVVLASGGYPGHYETGTEISGVDAVPDAAVFHAGTALRDGKLVTAGGRVLGVTALGDDLASARERAYAAAKKIEFRGAHFRTDIGAKALPR
ncbi:MAG: phosphoribosylamine--glycine ligase, partial [Planctomycetes bacterium]|nr:phosphoribosylamine--glycine ligase [Planctomycetota bacterium]